VLRTPRIHWTGGWVGPRDSLHPVRWEKSLVPTGNQIPAVQPMTCHYTNWVILAPCTGYKYTNVIQNFQIFVTLFRNIGCSLCRLTRCPEHLISWHWYLPANWRSSIRWSPDQWVSQCYTIECDRSLYCALFCVFMTHVNQCPISLRSEHTIHPYKFIAYSMSKLVT
jgi:hypothetical protein